MGGKGLETMVPPFHDWYWEYLVDTLCPASGVTAAQVQVAWIKSASKEDSVPEFPLQADSIYEKYIRSIQRIKEYFPNLKILYIGSHAYGGYSSEFSDNADLAGEPAAYYGGFGVKWVIEAQINGDPRLKYKGATVKAPWICWGPYYWADGIIPRVSDGLTWVCSDYEPDGGGFHLAEAGKEKESDMLIDFLYNNFSSKKWFRNGATWTACDPFLRNADGSPIDNNEEMDYYDDELIIYPSPNNGNFFISYYKDNDTPSNIRVINNQGQTVYSEIIDQPEGDLSLHVILPKVAAGIYHISIEGNNTQLEKTIMINN
ncbi:MAG: T9SS type A sorting domain-containing protein [Chitinophagales bacterium]